MDHTVKNMSDRKSKRVRKYSSPRRPTCTKKKVKGSETSSTEPPLICLDDIPLPSAIPPPSDHPRDAINKTAVLDFIPLPPSPPPLPPPMPAPPPPPDHSEMDEVLSDFFVIDTTASSTLFPIPLPPSYVSNRQEDPKEGSNTLEITDIENDPDEISVINNDCVLPDQFKNINLVDISKDSAPSSRKSADSSPIDVVFEGHWPWVVKSSEGFLGPKKTQLLHTNTSVLEQQVRNCHHSTNPGLRSLEKTPEPEISLDDSSQPDIITLDSTANSFIGEMSPNILRFDVRGNISLEEEEEDIIPVESSGKKGKSQKQKKKKKANDNVTEDHTEDSIVDRLRILRQEANSCIQEVAVIDPDVVEIDDECVSNKLSQSEDYSADVEVVELEESDNEAASTSAAGSPENMDNMVVVDMCESDRDSVSSESNPVGQGVDISTNEFIALGDARLQSLENSEIDLDDEVLDHRKHLEDLRKWHTTRLGEEVFLRNKLRKRDTVFTLLSYNVLAQQLLLDNKFLYRDCQEHHLDWKYRWALLQYEVQDLNPDVILFQEVQASHYYSHFLPWMTHKGYNGLYKKRTGEKCDGCGVFFKTSKFSLVESCSVEYLQPRAKKVLDRDNIGLIAKLAPVTSPESHICVATTHFLYNPRRHDVKLAQAVVLLTELDRICYKGEKNGVTDYCPIILTGDFNSEPHTALLDLLKEGRLRYEGLSARTLTKHGLSPILEAELLPRSLGITDRCQHAVLAQSRFLESRSGPIFSLSDKRKIEESLIRLRNSDRNSEKPRDADGGGNGPMPTGWFSHSFNFNSVYRHYSKNAAEATTFHNKWTSVDYILYSRVYNHSRSQPIEGPLKLLARYGLLTGREAGKFAPLPSDVCPSDHFPLAAQFLLQG